MDETTKQRLDAIDAQLAAIMERLDVGPEIRRLDVKPGEVVVLEFPDPLTRAQMENVRGTLRDQFGLRGMVLDSGATVAAVLSPEQAERLDEQGRG